MDQFRTLLKSALAANAHRVCITPGERSSWTLSDDGLPIVAEIPPFDIAAVDQLIRFLFPDFETQRQKLDPITGVLQIPTVGALNLLAKPFASSAVIYIYLPAGEKYFAQDCAAWRQEVANQDAMKVPPRSVSVPLPPPPVVTAPEKSAKPGSTLDMFKNAVKKISESKGNLGSVASTIEVAPAIPPTNTKSSAPLIGPMQNFSVIQPTPLSEVEAAAAVEVGVEMEPDLPEATFNFVLPPPTETISFDIPSRDSAFQRNSAGVFIPVPPTECMSKIRFDSGADDEGAVSIGENPIDPYLLEMVKKKASDMHLTLGQPIVLRVHAEMTRQGEQTLTADMMERLILPTLPGRNRKEFANMNDTDYAYELKGVGRFRINVFRDRNGVGAVMRHIPSEVLTAEQLKLPPAIMNLCKLNRGLVLVTGPTGSGKSTTLAAMVDWINKNRSEHILTIEDPIEFVHNQHRCLVNQREVHRHTGSFSRALKAALREDPDVILIGEMRDLETIAIAIETAETGHLVFGTLHTTTAMSTVDRIIDQFPADRQAQIRSMLASSLKGVVTQTLLKKKGGGRIAAHEILLVNDAVSSMIREGKIHTIANHMLTQKAEGNQLLNEALFKLVAEDAVEVQEALFKAVDKNDFLMSAARKNIKVA